MEELQITFSTLQCKQCVPYHHFYVFYFHFHFHRLKWLNEKTNLNNSTSLLKARNHKTKQQV